MSLYPKSTVIWTYYSSFRARNQRRHRPQPQDDYEQAQVPPHQPGQRGQRGVRGQPPGPAARVHEGHRRTVGLM